MSDTNPAHLLDLAQSKSGVGRAALADAIVDLAEDAPTALSDRERALMFDILHKIVLEVETAVRQSVSARLADMDDVPPTLIKQLANDEVDVAYPILTRSKLLDDRDLIEVVRFRSLEHQLAIAMRYAVSEEVSECLARTDDESVIDALLRNPNARISRSTMNYLVAKSRRVDTFQEPLLQRRELSAELARKMFLWVSAALRRHIIERFDLDEATVDTLLQRAAFDQIETVHAPDPAGSDGLAAEMAEAGLLEAGTMVKALAQGEIDLFVAMFARTADLRRSVVMRILFEKGGASLAIACKGIGMDRKTFAKVLTLSRAARPQRSGRHELEKALEVYDRATPSQIRSIIERWRLDPAFVAAIEAVEQSKAHA